MMNNLYRFRYDKLIIFVILIFFSSHQLFAQLALTQKHLHVQEVELHAIVEFFSKKTSKVIIPDQNIINELRSKKSKVILPMDLEKMKGADERLWDQVFEDILKIYGYTLIKKGDTYHLTKIKHAWNLYLPFRNDRERSLAQQKSEKVIVQVIRLKHTYIESIKGLFKYVSDITPPVFLADNQTLIVTTHESKIKRFLELLAVADVPPPPDKTIFVPYDLVRINSQQMKNHIQAYFNRNNLSNQARKSARIPFPLIMIDESSQRILVSAIPEDQQKIKAMIKFFDKPLDEKKYNPMKIIRLKNSNADELAPLLNKVLTKTIFKEKKGLKNPKAHQEDVSIVPYKQLNALIISTETAKTLSTIESVVYKLDVRRKQVLIRSTIIEVNNNTSFEFGADLGLKSSPHNSSKFGIGAGTNLGTAGLNVDLSNQNNPISLIPDLTKDGLQLMFPYKDYDMIPLVLNMANANSEINVLATPSIICDDNEKALLRITENRSFNKTTLGPDGTPITSQGGFNEAGIILLIKPTISSMDYLKLEIEQSVDRFITNSTGGDSINKREASTIVTIPNNTSVVFGGLTERSSDKGSQSVPVLSKIPVLGHAFKRTSRNSNSSTLYFFITPHIISEFNEMNQLSDRYHDELRENASPKVRNDRIFKNVRNHPYKATKVKEPVKAFQREASTPIKRKRRHPSTSKNIIFSVQ